MWGNRPTILGNAPTILGITPLFTGQKGPPGAIPLGLRLRIRSPRKANFWRVLGQNLEYLGRPSEASEAYLEAGQGPAGDTNHSGHLVSSVSWCVILVVGALVVAGCWVLLCLCSCFSVCGYVCGCACHVFVYVYVCVRVFGVCVYVGSCVGLLLFSFSNWAPFGCCVTEWDFPTQSRVLWAESNQRALCTPFRDFPFAVLLLLKKGTGRYADRG